MTPSAPPLDPLRGPAITSRLLSNGRYTVLATAAGTGFSSFGDHALTAWRPDTLEDTNGLFIYLRDLESGTFWSSGYLPVPLAADHVAARWQPGLVTWSRVHDGIESQLEITVLPDMAAEIRRLTIRNASGRARVIEVTSFAEVALAPSRAFAAHPVFSKLFLQTEFVPEHRALLVRRRARSPEEEHPWMIHASPRDDERRDDELQWETDRARFLGRRRSVSGPWALTDDRRLSETAGNVLDPMVGLRRVVRLDEGGTAEMSFLLGAAATRDGALDIAARCARRAAIAGAFEVARRAAVDRLAELGLSEPEAAYLEAIAGALLYGSPMRGAESASWAARAHDYWRSMGISIGADGAALEELARDLLPHLETTPPVITTESTGGSPRAAADMETPPGDLQFWNGFGGFDRRDASYVILRTPPRPWINVIADERFGFLMSDAGAGYTWSENSREHPLTPWFNDPLLDPHGEAFYIRDEKSRRFWSPLPGPAPDEHAYEMRHDLGFSTCAHRSPEWEERVTSFVPHDAPFKATVVRMTNTSPRPRRLSLFAYHRIVLGSSTEDAARAVRTEMASGGRALFAQNVLREEFAGRTAFLSAIAPDGADTIHFSADRSSFIGRFGSPARPLALESERHLDGRTGSGLEPCMACQVELEVPADGSREVVFLFGDCASADEAASLLARYDDPAAAATSLAEALAGVRVFWKELAAIQVRTPSAGLDLLVNGWLPYQALSSRIWGRTALYQSSGAFGFRDQLQDAAALVHLRPDLTRREILLHAAHQFVEGDVMHWWHPPTSAGIRTRCSDDLLWLPYLTAHYIDVTGDEAILAERVPYIEGPPVPAGKDEIFLVPAESTRRESLYDHACRSLDRSLATGRHGLPLFGTGDWNDGMNRVGRRGLGESVWMGFFLYDVLGAFIPLCRSRGDAPRVERYSAHRDALRDALDRDGWDGEWYRRGYYDSGAPLGSKSSDECRVDALAQAWAVISGAAPPERAERAMDAVERHLISEKDGLIRLLTPPFENTAEDPGYIKGYVPGIRENGGQYTHAALWVIQAMARLRRRDRVARLLDMVNPVHHARTASEVARYQVEPYVIAADVYGAPPHVGRGGWTWYTGSAGWMYRVAVEWLLGLRMIGGKRLRIAPCIPDDWPEFHVSYRLPGGSTRYDIRVVNPSGSADEVVMARLDGGTVTDGRAVAIEDGACVIGLSADGDVHQLEVTLGKKHAGQARRAKR